MESDIDRKPIAQIDMDGTLADYDGEMVKVLNRIRHPSEPEFDLGYKSLLEGNQWLRDRMLLVMSDDSFWDRLPRFKLGWDVFGVLKEQGWDIRVLTKGPWCNPRAWGRKVTWCLAQPECLDNITVTMDKSQVYGRVLVDDWPSYITGWLENRPRGLAVMPAGKHNEGFSHPSVVRYDGSNLDEVRERLLIARDR
jgi:5'-nucleotidase